MPIRTFDCIVVGAGIVGLAHALAAHRRGMRVAVLDRDGRASGASVRNFGFITVTGQAAGATWRRAMRTRDVWAEIAPLAGIPILQTGLMVAARRPEALTVLQEFAASEMGAGCELVTPDRMPEGFRGDLAGGLFSPHELRLESRDAIPKLAAWLAGQGVTFVRPMAVRSVARGAAETMRGSFRAPRIVVCPGPDLATLFPEAFARRQITLCKLQMMRLASPGFILPHPAMSDLGLLRYAGYEAAPSLGALRERVVREQPLYLANGIHLIAVRSADGSLVVGDSHHYGLTPDPFLSESVDALILSELKAVLKIEAPVVRERWMGVYPSGKDMMFSETVAPGVQLVSVTSGTGASTAFAIAEETVAGWG
jgi:FAD dependent oxidoreductase TIGR03364